MEVREGLGENNGTANQVLSKLDASSSLLRQLAETTAAEADFFAEMNKRNANMEEAKYEIFNDEADMLISALSNSQLKEIVNLIKDKALLEDKGGKKGNFVSLGN